LTEKPPPPPPPPPVDPEPASPPLADPDERPRLLTIGCILTWVGCAIGLAGGLSLFMVDEDSSYFDNLDPDVDRADAASALHTIGVGLSIWCVLVAVVAVVAYRGAKWAAVTLLVMGIVFAVIGFLNLLAGNPYGLFAPIWALGAAYLVSRHPSSRAWYDAVAERRAAGA
jgi:hypothetical protein